MRLAFIGNNDLPGVEADARFAAHHGFAGLEYNYWGEFRDLKLETVQQMRESLDRYGVKAAALGLWGFNHISADAAERAEAHEMLGRAIEFAKVLGAETLITGGGDLPGAPLADKVAEFAKVFPPFLEKIADAGMKPAMYAVHGNSFFVNLAAYEAVWEQFPQVGIKYDPANWSHAGEDYLAVARYHGDKIAYVHIKEHTYHNGDLASQPAAGMGDIQWGKVFAFLYEHGYDGYLSMEPHGPLWSQGALREKMLLLSKKYLGQFIV
jgi:sugar phosphate isomerase/epimerase